MDGVIRAHCMGMEFPKRDTDSPRVSWSYLVDWMPALPTAADLDAVAEEQRVKEKTSAKVPNR